MEPETTVVTKADLEAIQTAAGVVRLAQTALQKTCLSVLEKYGASPDKYAVHLQTGAILPRNAPAAGT